MKFPQKYPIPNWIKLTVMLAAIASILIHNCSQDQIAREITISDVKITDYSRVHVEVDYTLTNHFSHEKEVWLMLKVYDDHQQLLASSLFSVTVKANTKVPLLKILDKLERPLNKNEKPAKVTLNVYLRKVLL